MSELGRNWEREDLGGGRFRHTQDLKPIAYFQGGLWRRIVRDWADGDASFPHVISQAGLRVRTAPKGDRRILPVQDDDNAWFSISSPFIQIGGNWTQPSLGAFSRQGNLLQATSTNVNTYIWHGGHFIKAGFLLKGGWQPANGQFAFRVGLNGLTRQGGQLLYNGQPVMRLRPPVVYDWDNQEDVRQITRDFVNIGANTYILFTLPSLAGMARPVVDPTLTLQPDATDGIDTRVFDGSPNTNYGTNVEMYLGGNRLGLVKFDVSSIFGNTVTSATMSLWNNQVQANNLDYTLNSILIANSAWTEAGATWNYAVASTIRWSGDTGNDGGTDAGCSVSGTDYNATALATFTYVALTPIDTEQQITLNVAQVQDWVDGNNYGSILRCPGSNNIGWRSSDYADDATKRPKLVVEYTEAGAIMNQFQFGNLGADLFDGALIG